MNTTSTFNYDKFIKLSELELSHYMEPLVINPTTIISKAALLRMLSELPTYDEYHIVYALELGAKYSPETFAMQLPQYLTYEQGSVWSAALRNLEQLPNEYVTNALVDSVRKVHSSYSTKAWITKVLDSLEKRLNSGGNSGR